MISLRLEQCELTYEGAFLKPAFSLVDAPGKVCDLLLQALNAFDCTGADLAFEDGEPDERGVTCNVEELGLRVTVHGDRLEVHCTDFAKESAAVSNVLTDVWSGLEALNAGLAPKTHSFLFEADSEIRGARYQGVLSHLAPVPQTLPTGTETAVVYYLPPGSGLQESSLVLNRSAQGSGRLQITATLVFEAESFKPAAAVTAAAERLSELLRNLGFEWIER
jgi:hypothetical protein